MSEDSQALYSYLILGMKPLGFKPLTIDGCRQPPYTIVLCAIAILLLMYLLTFIWVSYFYVNHQWAIHWRDWALLRYGGITVRQARIIRIRAEYLAAFIQRQARQQQYHPGIY